MSAISVALYDGNFEGQPGVSPFIAPTMLTWNRDAPNETKLAVFTDHKLNEPSHARRKIAWLVESPEVIPDIYDRDEGFYSRFDTVLTFKRSMLERGGNGGNGKYLWMPFGSTHLRREDFVTGPLEKTKVLSMIASSKLFTGGHKLRCDIADAVRGTWAEEGLVIDLFGKGRERPLEWKVDGLRDYMFSIAIENCAVDWYFSEKLIDCFLTRTVPVYFGCPCIGKFFNTDGMLFVNSVDQAKRVCRVLLAEGTRNGVSAGAGASMYENMKDAIADNYRRAQQYVTPEDLIAEVYLA